MDRSNKMIDLFYYMKILLYICNMTIIYSNWNDEDCRCLQRVWQCISDVNVIEITSDMNDWDDVVDEAISNESDTLIFLGHGSTRGLFAPDYNYGLYILHENNVHLIHARNVICCWCYASTFVKNHNLNAFATSMFISNVNEASDNGITNYTQDQINDNSIRFYDEINYLIRENIPLSEWVMMLGDHMDIDNEIDVFNRQRLFYQ